jgi:hypothetical protein
MLNITLESKYDQIFLEKRQTSTDFLKNFTLDDFKNYFHNSISLTPFEKYDFINWDYDSGKLTVKVTTSFEHVEFLIFELEKVFDTFTFFVPE